MSRIKSANKGVDRKDRKLKLGEKTKERLMWFQLSGFTSWRQISKEVMGKRKSANKDMDRRKFALLANHEERGSFCWDCKVSEGRPGCNRGQAVFHAGGSSDKMILMRLFGRE